MRNEPQSDGPALTAACVLLAALTALAWTPKPVSTDPLMRMPGTQPGTLTLEDPANCMNCHAGYDSAVEPGFNWQGSMMGQTARDPLFFACFTVAAQDSIWALGNPNAADLCMRCHFPKGWLEGRSDPPNASLMTGADYNGVQCDSCHSMSIPSMRRPPQASAREATGRATGTSPAPACRPPRARPSEPTIAMR